MNANNSNITYLDNTTASNFARYKYEREGLDTIETASGFITYKIMGPTCFIQDLYIVPEQRQNGLGSTLTDELASRVKEAGCVRFTATVCPSAGGSTEALLAVLHYGFKLMGSDSQLIYLSKELM